MAQTFNVLAPSDVRMRWGVIRELLAKSMPYSRGELLVDDLLPLIEKNQMGLFGLEEDGELKLALTFEIVHYPRRTIMFLGFVGGKGGRAMAANFDKIAAVGREFGADAVRCACRREIADTIKYFFPDAEESHLVMERKLA